MFMADSRYEAKVAIGMYGVKTMRCRKGMQPKNVIKLVSKKARKAFYEGQAMPKTNNLVVFGNPPYQQQREIQKGRAGGETRDKAIYNLFVEAVIDNLNPRYLSFITPSKWMAGGVGLNSYRKRMMNDRRIRFIKHFAGEQEVFPEVRIVGGTSYFLWDRDYNGKCNFDGTHRYLNEYDVVVADNKSISILDKVKSSHKAFINERCIGKRPFGLASNFNNWKETGIPCYSRGRIQKFVREGQFEDKNDIQKKWKACVSAGNGAACTFNSDGKISYDFRCFIIESGSICTETYVVVNVFDSQCETENFITYMKTKFFRFMLGLRVVTQHVSKENFAFVPDLGDYSKPVTDADLYKRFGLTPEEIAYIESKIKAL